MLIVSLSSPPNSFPEVSDGSRSDENTSILISRACYFYTGKDWVKDLFKKEFFFNWKPPLTLPRPSLPTSHSAKLFALSPRPNILPSKKPTWGPAPRKHLRLCLGPGSAEIKARLGKQPPQPRPDPTRPSPGHPPRPGLGSEGPRAQPGTGLPARPPSNGGGVWARPPSRLAAFTRSN